MLKPSCTLTRLEGENGLCMYVYRCNFAKVESSREGKSERLCFLRPSSLAKGQFFAFLGSTAVLFAAPGVVFTEAVFGVGGVVEVDLRNLCLDECPDAPALVSIGSK